MEDAVPSCNLVLQCRAMDPKLYGYSDDALQDVNPRRVVNGPSHVHVAEQGDSVGPGAPGRMSPVGQHEAVHAPRASRPHHNHSAVSQSHAPQAAAPVWPPSQPAKAAASEPRLPQESKPSNPADAIAQIQQQRSSKHLEKVQVPLGITRKSSQQRVHPLGHRSGSSAHKSMTSITSRDIGSSADTLPSLPSPYKGQQSPAHAPVAAAMHAQPSTGSTTRTRSPSNTEISSVEKSSPHRSLSPASQVASTHGQDSLAHKQATHHSPAKRSGSIADSFPSPHAQEHQKAEHSLQAEAAPVNDQEQIAPRKAAIRQSASPQKVAAQQAKDVEAQDIAYPPISKVVQQLKNSNQSVESSSSSEAPVQVPAAHAVSGTPSVAPGRLQAATSRSAIAQPQRPFVPAKSQESTAKVIANSSAAVPAPGSVQKAALAAQPAHLAPDTVAFPTGGKGNYKQAAVALATGASSLAVQRSLDASTQPDSTQLPSARDQPASPSDCAKPGALEVVQGEEVVQEDAGKSDSKRERSETERKDIVRTVSATETESSMQSASPGAAQAEGAMQGHIVGGAYDVGRKVAPSRPAPSKGAPALPSVAEGAEGTMPSAAGGGPLKSSRMLTSSIQRQPQPPRHMKGQQWRTTEDTDTSDSAHIYRLAFLCSHGAGSSALSTTVHNYNTKIWLLFVQ